MPAKNHLGECDEQLNALINRLLTMPVEEYTPLILQLSREELLNRFCL